MSWRALSAALPVGLLLCVGCSGGGSSNNNITTGGGGTVTTPTQINVSANQPASGINIAVASPASSPAPNVIALGTDGQSAFSTGGTVNRSGTATIVAFGAGLSNSMQISFSGPNDITMGTVSNVTATDGTPGVSFPITVGSNAALGARTLIMQDTNHNITTFTGGLEVLP
jgi:hypothetical protein